MRIALDARGGEYAHGPIVLGAVQAARRAPDTPGRRVGALMPTAKGLSVLLDVGANVHPKPAHLYQYGVMGAIYAKYILQRDKPKIGLLNVGSEEDKGNELAKDTADLFRKSPLKDQFI